MPPFGLLRQRRFPTDLLFHAVMNDEEQQQQSQHPQLTDTPPISDSISSPLPTTTSTATPLQEDRKGKRRAIIVHEEPTERTPLLGQLAGTSQLPWDVVDEETEASRSSSRRRLWAKLTKVFLLSLLTSIFLLSLLALLAWSYAARASGLTPQDILNKHLTFAGPDKVDVLNVTAEGRIHVRVEGRLGLDIGAALGINSAADDGVMDRVWKGIGRQGVRTLDSVSVNLSTISLLPEFDPHEVPLALLDVPPLEVPLSVDPPEGSEKWLSKVVVTAVVRPTTNATVITAFLKDAWQRGMFAVRVDVEDAYVRGGLWNKASWRSRFHGKLTNIQASLRLQVPSIPGLPPPGRAAPLPSLAQLVTLQSFSLRSTPAHLRLSARASVVNPVPADIAFTAPPLQFIASLPSFPPPLSSSSDKTSNGNGTDEDKPTPIPIPIASLTTLPFSLTHPNISLHLSGHALPLPPSSLPSLSRFLTRYLSGLPNTILVSSPSLLPGPNTLQVEAEFPAPNPRPKVLRDVTIREMKVRPGGPGGAWLASGRVEARVVLPRGMEVEMDVEKVLPDVVVFDGEVPAESASAFDDAVVPWIGSKPRTGGEKPPKAPLPDPLPERAFGRIHPDEWLNATCVKEGGGDDDDGDDGEGDENMEGDRKKGNGEKNEGSAFAISAKVVDVPLEVLPGRQKEFSNFVSKVIFSSDGALAGIQGTAAVRVAVEGLPLGEEEEVRGRGEAVEGLPLGEEAKPRSGKHLTLEGLPFQGSVRISKKSLLKPVSGGVGWSLEGVLDPFFGDSASRL